MAIDKKISSIQENRVKWVAALRSGAYKQGHGHLHAMNPDGDDDWCCLGVSIEVLHPGMSDAERTLFYRSHLGTLPVEARRELGLNYYQVQNLIDLNDGRKRSFNEIADYIEQLPLP